MGGGGRGSKQTGTGWADPNAKVQKRKCIFDHFLLTLPPPKSADTDLVATPTFTPPQTSGVDLMAMDVVAKNRTFTLSANISLKGKMDVEFNFFFFFLLVE